MCGVACLTAHMMTALFAVDKMVNLFAQMKSRVTTRLPMMDTTQSDYRHAVAVNYCNSSEQ